MQHARKAHLSHGCEHSRSLRNFEHLESRNVVYKIINIAIGFYVFVGQSCIRKLSEKKVRLGISDYRIGHWWTLENKMLLFFPPSKS
jgi:hypothetical protein